MAWQCVGNWVLPPPLGFMHEKERAWEFRLLAQLSRLDAHPFVRLRDYPAIACQNKPSEISDSLSGIASSQFSKGTLVPF